MVLRSGDCLCLMLQKATWLCCCGGAAPLSLASIRAFIEVRWSSPVKIDDFLRKSNQIIANESKNQLWALLPEVDSLVKLNENIAK